MLGILNFRYQYKTTQDDVKNHRIWWRNRALRLNIAHSGTVKTVLGKEMLPCSTFELVLENRTGC